MPSGVAAIEYRSDFVKRCTVTPTRPMRIGTTVTRTTSSPVALMIEMMTPMSTSAMIVVVLSSSEPASRAGCICTTEAGGAAAGSSSGASSSATRSWMIDPDLAATAVACPPRAPAASPRMSARSASACFEPRKASGMLPS